MEETYKTNKKTKRKPESKASEEHKQLAKFIKDIHLQLRNDYKKHGAGEAWKTHISQEKKLKNYAESMYQLATKHWEKKSQITDPLTYCRIEWIKNQCKNYFTKAGVNKFDEKEKYLIQNEVEECKQRQIETIFGQKINVLDVGSCYNPFSKDDFFSVTAIDIAPYSKDVIKCDFLNLKVDDRILYSDEETLIEMPKGFFDAVIFSLLLEYIPCPEQRFLCCQKAHELLKDGGILLIVTPDSKHAGANTKILNTSWKVVLAQLGFMRISYEKLSHVHCTAFRKCFFKESALKRINWNKISDDEEIFSSSKIFIPQDFQTEKCIDKTLDCHEESVEHNDSVSQSLFSELPCGL